MANMTVVIRSIGNSLGFILPAEAVQMLQAKKGEKLILTKSPDGIRISPYDPDFEKKMVAARSVFSRYKNALRELAK